MSELTYFYLSNCPHCRRADLYLRQVLRESPEYRAIRITRIEEREQKEIAQTYDYFRVPCFYLGARKLHEGVIRRSDVRRVLQIAHEAAKAEQEAVQTKEES